MQLSKGTMLGPYEIVGMIGAGGMGEVYRARDTRLEREVAIKVSAQKFSERFDREARAVAALNHPNVCTLYDVGPNYLVMELVEGESPRGPLPLDEALRIAWQIADALEAAHEKGITHRDLKPGNIKIKPNGTVKVLDFGLAKVAPTSRGDSENSPTISMAATEAGVILGTAGYMPPEQARGKPVDKRADIWAFGVVLYELLTGDRMFVGETMSDTLAQVLMKEPDLSRVPAKTRRLLSRCLQKEPKLRLRDIGEARFLLEEAPAGPAAGVGTRSSFLPWILASVATLAAVALGFLAYRHLTEETRVVKLFLPPPEKATFAAANDIPAVSPDGRRIVFAVTAEGKTSLWVRELDALTARELPGTDDPRFPFWSPDSRTVAFFAGSKLKKIDVAGGPAVTLCDAANGLGGSWSQSDVIVFAPNQTSGLVRVPPAGGTPTLVTELDPSKSEISHRYPWFLPDGRHFLYTARNANQEKTLVYVGDTDSKTETPVLLAKSNTAYSAPDDTKQGYLLFVRERTLMAQAFDPNAGKTLGEAIPIAEQIDTPAATFAETHFSASRNGVLAYTSGATGGSAQLTWFDRSGKATGVLGSPGGLQWPAISPDGKTVAVDRDGAQGGFADVWLYDLSHNTNSRFTLGPQNNRWPVWSPDAGYVAYYQSTSEGYFVKQKATSGTTPDEVLDKPGPRVRATDWSKDGRYIFEERLDDPNTRADVWVLPTFGDKKPFAYLNGEFSERLAKLAPDGQWLAYQSDESKRNEIVVETFPKRGGKWSVSNGGGTRPVWSRDGKELFFVSADRKMMAVEIRGGLNFERGTPRALFDVRLDDGAFFDVGKDGKFLIPTLVEQPAVVPMTVVINWAAGLKKN